jgi:hypothetical protein
MCEKCDTAEADFIKAKQEIFDRYEKALDELRTQAFKEYAAAYERKLEAVRAAHPPSSPSL